MFRFFKKMNKKLSDAINRKFTEIIDVTDYEVETDDGFSDIVSINMNALRITFLSLKN